MKSRNLSPIVQLLKNTLRFFYWGMQWMIKPIQESSRWKLVMREYQVPEDQTDKESNGRGLLMMDKVFGISYRRHVAILLVREFCRIQACGV